MPPRSLATATPSSWAGPYDNSDAGAAWVFVRNNGVWTQQGAKLVGANGSANALQGVSVALSADGNTAIIGGQEDNQHQGAAWVFTRSNGNWTQQGAKLVGNDTSGSFVYQGSSVALSGDGNTAIVGGPGDTSSYGAAWIYMRSNGVWTQQGAKLAGSGIGANLAFQGQSVALSTDGNTAVIGGPAFGAVWVFTRSGQTWTQYGNLLQGTGYAGGSNEGSASAISGDGKTILFGAPTDNTNNGAAWVFTLSSNGTWTQQGSKLTIFGASGQNQFGQSLALSADGNTAVVGSPEYGTTGAAWIFTRSFGSWFQVKSLIGTGYSSSFPPAQGQSVTISADGDTVAIGGSTDNSTVGAAWVFTKPAAHDLDASGESDIVWRQNGGEVAVWLTKNGSVLSSAGLGIVPATWSIVGQRDFNGDGNADLLWRDTAGNLAVWFMQGSTVTSSKLIGNVPTSWSVVGLGDFNGDGSADIVWRNTNGDVAIWLMNGEQVLSSGVLGNVPANWSVSGVDLNGNIFWRDSTSGTVAVWAVFGLQVLQSYNFGAAPSNWSIVGLGDFDGTGFHGYSLARQQQRNGGDLAHQNPRGATVSRRLAVSVRCPATGASSKPATSMVTANQTFCGAMPTPARPSFGSSTERRFPSRRPSGRSAATGRSKASMLIDRLPAVLRRGAAFAPSLVCGAGASLAYRSHHRRSSSTSVAWMSEAISGACLEAAPASRFALRAPSPTI